MPLVRQIVVDSFNYAFENFDMSISQKRGIISLIPKKDKTKNTSNIGDQLAPY